MGRYPYLQNRNGTFYFRIAVPIHLMGVLNRKELIASLRTQDPSKATIISVRMAQAVNEVFQKLLRGEVVAEEELLRCIAIERPNFSPVLPLISIAQNALVTNNEANQGQKISTLFDQYLEECRGERAKTTQKKKAVFSIWLELHGDMPILTVEKAEAREFKALLMRIPANMHKYYPGKTFRDLDLNKIEESQRLSTRSINGGLAFLRAFFNWAKDNGHCTGDNPFNGLFLKDAKSPGTKRNSFSSEQLHMIFSSPVYQGCKSERAHDRYIAGKTIIKDALYWIPLVALFSGARLQEIAQLYVNDIQQVGDFWVFDFNEEGPDKQLKTISSRRKTPIHPELIRLGFLEHVMAQQDCNEHRVFSDLPMSCDGTYSNLFSKRFNYMLKRLKVKTDQTSFHSFRHTFIDALRNVDIPKEIREALVGHLGQRTAHDLYGSTIGLDRLYRGICQLTYRITHLQPH